MNTYIIQFQSNENNFIREIKVKADYLVSKLNHYEFLDINEQIIACLPIEKTIILRIKEPNEGTIDI
jgi:hypothetical protein